MNALKTADQNTTVSCSVGTAVGQLEQHRIDNVQPEKY